jgi:hypothetical protein
MALTVGTDAYISLADFKSWADDRAYDYSSFTDTAIEAAIRIASVDFINVNYTFKGDALSDSQPLQLPTDEVAIADILNGAAQASWQQLKGRLFVDVTEVGQTGQVVSETKKVASLSTSTTYAEGYQYTNVYPTTRIDDFLKPYTVAIGGLGNPVRG